MKTDERKYWVIAVGTDSFFWDYCKKDSFIVTGWSTPTDLNSVQSLDDFKKIYIDARLGNNRQAGQTCPQIWNFAKIMKKDDLVVVRKGQKTILGIGKIASDHFYVDSKKIPLSAKKEYAKYRKRDYNKDAYSDIRDVKWIEDFPSEGINIPKQGSWLKTVMKMKKEDFDTFLNISKTGPNFNNSEINLLMKKKQVILYGPPGTGKTYNTKKIAVQISK